MFYNFCTIKTWSPNREPGFWFFFSWKFIFIYDQQLYFDNFNRKMVYQQKYPDWRCHILLNKNHRSNEMITRIRHAWSMNKSLIMTCVRWEEATTKKQEIPVAFDLNAFNKLALRIDEFWRITQTREDCGIRFHWFFYKYMYKRYLWLA